MAATSEPLDFHRYHRDELPELLRAGRGALAARGTRALGSLAFRLPAGDAYTYLPQDADVEVVAGEASAETVIELAPELWQNLVHELDAAAGLLYGGRARCVRGSALRWVAWEPALRAMWSGRPVYDGQLELLDRHGAPLDPAAAFTLAGDREDMAHFLRTAGYLFVRGVFAPDEIAAFRAEAELLAGEAKKGDKLSWWGKNAAGEEVLTRVTRAAANETPRGACGWRASIGPQPRCHEPGSMRSSPVSGVEGVRNTEATSRGHITAWPPMPQSRCQGRSPRPSLMLGLFQITETPSSAEGGTRCSSFSSARSLRARRRGSRGRARRPGFAPARVTRVSTSSPAAFLPHQESLSPFFASPASPSASARKAAISSGPKTPRTNR